MRRFPLLALALFLSLGRPAAQEEENAPDSVPALVRTLREHRDDADVDVVKKLANKGTREAMEGLLAAYEALQSIYMRRAVCQGLAQFDRNPDAAEPALEHLMNVATTAPERELREAAVELLGGCENHGRAFLRRIVESPADDEVRERSMEHHVRLARPEDSAWYRELYQPKAPEKSKKAARKDADASEERVPFPLPKVRLSAFEALAPKLEIEELVAAVSDPSGAIRQVALSEFAARDQQEAAGVAETLLKRAGEPVPTRVAAAGILLKARGPKVAEELIDQATLRGAPRELAYGLADLLAELDDDATNKKLLKSVGKGEGTELFFYLRATKRLQEEKLVKTLTQLLGEKDPEVRLAAAEILGERRERAALSDLEELLGERQPPEVVAGALGAISAIRTNDVAWQSELVARAADQRPEVKSAALEALGRTQNPDYLPAIAAALSDPLWSTRLAAARAIEALRVEAGVGALCARIGEEHGRMQSELSQILFRLTGKTFGINGRLWAEWWQKEGSGFRVVDASRIEEIRKEEEARRLREVSRSEFFGVRLESHRALFILDVSGSMEEMTRGRYVGEPGAKRIDVAKRELLKALDGLEPASFFNIVTFSDEPLPWHERVVQRDEESLANAKSFIEGLRAAGGTNLYGALELAFEDPDVDTLYVLSDGEPSLGDVIDPRSIRDRVAAWNRHRKVEIHCIAIGGSLRVLEWLAEDTGGSYVRTP
jgi:hypothetical protein